MAIVYDPDSSASLQEAEQMQQQLIKSKSDLSPRMVPVTDLGQLKNAQYAFVTDGLEKHYRRIDTFFRANKILSFTLQRGCIENNCCAVYINAKNRVEIIVNKSVTDAVQASFKPVFLMMITVI